MITLKTLWVCCGAYCAGTVVISVAMKPASYALIIGQVVSVVVFSVLLTLRRGE